MRRTWLWILALLVATAAFVYKFPPADQSGLLSVVPSGVLAVQAPEKAHGPNIVVITSDDQGWKDVGFHGSAIRTPNLDALAAGGALLEQFYAQPQGGSTRTALLTGRYPFRFGANGVPAGERTLPQALKTLGYETVLLGDAAKEGGYSTALLGDDAVKAIDGYDQKAPLFLKLAFNTPQAPFQATTADLDGYNTVNDPARRAYAAQVTATDEQIGRVVAALDKKGLRDNTLIVFQSAQGKDTDDEGGARVVAVANWPGHIKPGTVVNEMIDVVDLYPTLIGVAGATVAKGKALDGVDVWDAISDGKPSSRTEIVYDLQPSHAAIRQGAYKLDWRTTLPQSVELFDLSKDPSEKFDVSAAHADKVTALQQRANELAAELTKIVTQ